MTARATGDQGRIELVPLRRIVKVVREISNQRGTTESESSSRKFPHHDWTDALYPVFRSIVHVRQPVYDSGGERPGLKVALIQQYTRGIEESSSAGAD